MKYDFAVALKWGQPTKFSLALGSFHIKLTFNREEYAAAYSCICTDHHICICRCIFVFLQVPFTNTIIVFIDVSRYFCKSQIWMLIFLLPARAWPAILIKLPLYGRIRSRIICTCIVHILGILSSTYLCLSYWHLYLRVYFYFGNLACLWDSWGMN